MRAYLKGLWKLDCTCTDQIKCSLGAPAVMDGSRLARERRGRSRHCSPYYKSAIFPLTIRSGGTFPSPVWSDLDTYPHTARVCMHRFPSCMRSRSLPKRPIKEQSAHGPSCSDRHIRKIA